MGGALDGAQVERNEDRRVAQEPGDGLGDDAALLRARPALDEHLEVQVAGGESLEGVLADGAEAVLVNVVQQPVFQVGVAELAGVVVAQDTLDVGGRAGFRRRR